MEVEQTPTRRLVAELAERLDRRPEVGGVAVAGWRFELGSWVTLRAGLKEGRLGSPYEPPAASRGTSGAIYLRWSDGCSSSGSIDSRIVDELDERLAEWRDNTLQDPDAPEILTPQPLPTVQTMDAWLSQLVTDEPAPLLTWLKRARDRLAAEGIERVHANSGASRTWRYVYNSCGLRVAYPETSASLYLGAQELYWRTYSRRRWPSEAEMTELLEDVALSARRLTDATAAPIGICPVLLAPGLAMSMLGTLLVTNLGGASIAAGRSAFTLDDFRRGRQVMRDDLRLVIDTLLDLEGAASPVSGEGVPGGRAALVEAGRLVQPIVDLKYAARTGFPPTPVPGGGPAFLLRGEVPPRPLAAVQAEMATGVQLHAVLGLHSQDSSSGRYSLVAPQALVMAGGQPAGRAKVALSGNFFDHLADERTELVEFPYSLNPGLLIWTALD